MFHRMFHVNLLTDYELSRHALPTVTILFFRGKYLERKAPSEARQRLPIVGDCLLSEAIGFQRIHSPYSFPFLPFLLAFPFLPIHSLSAWVPFKVRTTWQFLPLLSLSIDRRI